MINPQLRRSLVGVGCIVTTVALSVMGGCAEEPEPVAKAPRAPATPPPPPKPRVTPIAELMAQLKIDERIVLPEDKAPKTDPERIAVLEFFDAFARGDDRSLHGMMPLADGLELEALVENGQWASHTEQITEIELECGPSSRSSGTRRRMAATTSSWPRPARPASSIA
jgi:hypothetical protein